jgi:trimeric autotransporter adhesin
MPTVEEQLGTLNNAVAALASAVGVSQTTMNANVSTAAGSATAASSSAAAANTARSDTQVLRDAMQTLSSGISSIALAAGSGPATSLQYPAVTGAVLATATDIVDGLTYDARADTDGGTWTARRADASWWRATLGTATRGARREFPKVVDIVLRSGTTATLTISDRTTLDGSNIPTMWMVIARSTGGIIDGTPRAVSALQGRIFVSTSLGLFTLDFPNDTATWADNAGVRRARGGISTFAGWGPVVAAGAIVSADANHAHARVLPGAELDGAGLPTPTVAVATAGGASVIHPNGAVYDITNAGGYSRCLILPDSRLVISRASGSDLVEFGPMPYADSVFSSWRTHFSAAFIGGSGPAIRHLGVNAPGQAILPGVIGSSAGLTQIAEEPGNPASSMAAYAATNFATGWVAGDCRLASLCDTTTGNITGVASITDGFSYPDTASMLAVWTDGSTGTGAATLASGAASLSRVDSGNAGRIRRSLTTVIGQTYLCRFSNAGTGSLAFAVGTTAGGTQISSTIHATGEGGWVQFVATATTTWVQAAANTNGQTTTFANFAFDLAIPDRSYRGRGLIPAGTLSRTAINSGDMVGFSGWSTSNFLTQPYNPDLDMGSGDFSFTGGFVLAATAAQETIFARDSATTGARIVLDIVATTSVLRLTISDGTNSATVSSPAAIDDGVFHIWHAVKRGASIELWVDGARVATASVGSVGSLTNTSAIFRTGVNAQTTNPLSSTSALTEIRATIGYATTPAQIRRASRDELAMAQAGQRTTLGGTSNAVQRMVFDESMNSLIVGTGDGVSEFNGLTRTAYLDTSNVTGLTNDNVQAVGGAAGFRLIAGAAQAVARRDATNGIDTMNRYGPRAPVRDGLMRSTGRTTDATPLNLSPRIFVGEREHIRGEVRVIGKMVGAAATQRCSALMEFVATRDAGGNVTLNLAAANQKDPLWNGTAAIDGTVETTSTTDAAVVVDTASQTLALQVTGIAATVMAWTAEWTYARISEETSYAA